MKSSKISIKEVQHVANLANLSLSAAQVKLFQSQLNSILIYVSQIKELDTSNTPETHQVSHLKNIFRVDSIQKDRILSQKEALSNAKKTHKGYFLVPAVLTQY